MSALLAATVSLVLPMPHGEDRPARITVVAQNPGDADVSCRLLAGGLTIDETIHAGAVKEIARLQDFGGLVRAACSDVISLSARVEPSERGDAPFIEHYDAVRLPAASQLVVRAEGSSIVVAEAAGRPCPMRLTWRRDGRPVRSDLRDFAAWQLRTIMLVDGAESIPGLSLEAESECDDGRVAVFVPNRDQHPYGSRADNVDIRSRGGTIRSDPPFSSFKAASFQDPATGLVYLRARWYDRESGAFLTPDPMAYQDSSNQYSFAAGDPVNFSDPTGLALYAFDGTGNDREKMLFGTNVAKLVPIYASGSAWYEKGVGTAWFSTVFAGVTGLGASARVKSMRENLEETWNAGDQVIDIIGYSRGAATALDFANQISRYGVMDRKLGKRVIPVIRFLGLFDTVGSFGIPGNDINPGIDLALPPNIQHVRHAIAANEYRSTFPLTRLSNSKCPHPDLQEKTFPGAHSDVGGGEEDNDMLSRLPLQWMRQQMVAAGIRMRPLRSSGLIPPSAVVMQHVSHNRLLYANDWRRINIGRLFGREPRRKVFTAPCYEH